MTPNQQNIINYFRVLENAKNLTGEYDNRNTIEWTSTSGVDGVHSTPRRVLAKNAIAPFPREFSSGCDVYAARVATTPFVSHLSSAVVKFQSYLSRKPPVRLNSKNNPNIALMLDNFDGAGNKIDIFFQHFIRDALARGSMLVIMTLPSASEKIQDSLSARAIPFIKSVAPENVKDFEIDRAGNFVRISINGEYNGQFAVYEYDQLTVSVSGEGGGAIVEKIPHGFDRCPVIQFVEGGATFPSLGHFSAIEPLQRRIINATSERTQNIRSSVFSMLGIGINDEGDRENTAKGLSTVGSNNAIIYSGKAPPAWIAPPSTPSEILTAEIGELKSEIAKISMDIEESGSAESGEAKRRRFEQLNAALSSFANSIQDFEMRIWDLFCKTTNTPLNEISVQWAKDFNLLDLTAELQHIADMKAVGFPQLAIIEKQKSVVCEMFGNGSPDVLEAVLNALDEQAKAGL